jgi:hypothetical protein
MNPAACYMYQATNVTQATARGNCRALGGDLVQYSTSASQLLVEGYFTASRVLSNYSYYIGVHRANSSQYVYTADNSSLPQVASTSPYAHWNWHQQAAAATPGYDCVLALAAYRFGFYLGGSSAAQQANTSFYQTDPANPDSTYGWNAYTCTGRYHSICQLPEDTFSCAPPPSPPPGPPQPSPPPSPPYPPTCAPLYNSTFLCDPAVTACYSSSANRTANFSSALQQCSGLGGSLSRWSSPGQQGLVERYFRWAAGGSRGCCAGARRTECCYNVMPGLLRQGPGGTAGFGEATAGGRWQVAGGGAHHFAILPPATWYALHAAEQHACSTCLPSTPTRLQPWLCCVTAAVAHQGRCECTRLWAKQLCPATATTTCRSQGTLPKYYWLGIRRAAADRPYVYVADNSSLPQLATGPVSAGAYAQWAWLQQSYSRLAGYHCGLAWTDLAYDRCGRVLALQRHCCQGTHLEGPTGPCICGPSSSYDNPS